MGKSNAERQAAYRARHFKAVEGERERLNLAVSVPAKAQLERLATCYAVTQREVIESLLEQGERRLLDSLPANEHGRYFDRELMLRSNEKTRYAVTAESVTA
jgi:hypothetical protein